MSDLKSVESQFTASFRSRKEACFCSGFTLIELIVVISVLGILVTLTAPTVMNMRNVVGKVVCAGHLRSLHCSFGAYINDNEQWPQCPENLSPSAEEQFWIDSLLDYGAPESVWKCPSLPQGKSDDDDMVAHKIHYTPTEFDDNPMSPRKWPTMPWLVEISEIHGGPNSSLLICSNGAVKTVQQMLNEDN